MKPSVWGPQFWFILHIISFEYPENPTEIDKNIYYSFYSSLRDILPCEMCKKHYREFLHKHPLMPFLDKKADFIQWVIDIHNQVNISLGKPVLSLDEVLDIYGNLDPISPFASVDAVAIAKKHEIKRYTKLYYWLVILVIIIIASRFYFNRYYFSF